jgi:hypothetical protein
MKPTGRRFIMNAERCDVRRGTGRDGIYGEPNGFRRLAAMVKGLGQPRQSRAYKVAVIEVQRLSAPAAAVLLPALVVALLVALSDSAAVQDRVVVTQMLESDTPPALAPVDDVKPPEALPHDLSVDFPLDGLNVGAQSQAPDQPADPRSPVNPQPSFMGPVLNAKSVVVLKDLYAPTRGAAARGALLAGGGGDPATEGAVLRALRWLKTNQQPDGSWKNQRIAMTGLAVLSFLAHGEKPGESPEFGETVRKALEFLVRSQRADGRFNGMDGNEYAHPIATYALCEAYGMTRNPNVRAAAERALVPIIRGQHPTGGWTYKMNPKPEADGGYRDDTSYMGWAAQALKAAKLADLRADGLDRAVKLAVKGFQKNAHRDGGFGYTGPDRKGLTGVGTLCMQLLGAANAAEVRKSLDLMDGWTPSFDAKGPQGSALQYYFYYAAQCKFHEGGKRWEKWNRAMKAVYLPAQKIQKSAVKDDAGRDRDIGWWENGDAHTDRPVMDTCLAALQLMVYYRYLPTTGEAAVRVEDEIAAVATDSGDIRVETGNL